MYQINEGRFVVPGGFEDTSNTVLKWSGAKGVLSLTIVRDKRYQHETIDEYIQRQLVELRKHLKGYRLLEQRDTWLGNGAKAIPGIQLTSQYTSNKAAVYQQQAGFITGSEQVLIFTITGNEPFDDEIQQHWETLLAHFEPTLAAASA